MNDLTRWWVTREDNTTAAPSMWASWKAPHRSMVPVALDLLNNITSVYELGCGSGPNLRLLKHIRPDISLGGCEPSPGLRAWASEHLGIHVDETALPEVTTDHWDVVLSCYTLAYLPPDDLKQVLTSLNARALVLLEPMGNVRSHVAGIYQTQYPELKIGSVPEYHHDYPPMLADAGWSVTWRWPLIPAADGLNAVLIAEHL